MSVASHLTRAGRLSAPVKAALAKNLIHDRSPVCDLYDLDALRGRFNEVQTALPNWNHAVAIKVHGQCPITHQKTDLNGFRQIQSPVYCWKQRKLVWVQKQLQWVKCSMH